MKNISSSLFILFSVLLMSSCRTIVDDKAIGQTNDAVTLFGFLNPDHDSITIGLNLVEGLTSSKTLTITQQNLIDAEVSLEHNGNKIILSYLEPDPQRGNSLIVFYAPNNALPILPGETYTVRAKNEGLFDLTSTTTVPKANFDFDYNVEGPYQSGQEYKIRIGISDPANEDNFYRISLENEARASIGISMLHDGYTNDEIKVDEKIQYSFTLHVGQMSPSQLNVINVSESIYRYARSIEKGAGNSGDPFAEPTTVYTNIIGGYGVFGAQSVKQKSIF